MKKQNMIKLAVTAALCLGLSGNALAAIDNGDLVRVVFDSVGTKEYATDLGNIYDLMSRTAAGEKNIVTGNGADAVTTSIFGATTQFSDLKVAYFTFDSLNNKWVGVSSGLTTLKNGSRQYSTFQSKAQALTYGATGTTGAYDLSMITANSALIDKSNTKAFYNAFYGGGTIASQNFGGYTVANADGVASLAALATGDSVKQNFFTWTGSLTDNASFGTLKFDLTMLADGSTVINQMDQQPVPVPAAAWLLASGLAGLVGVRRRMNKEA